MTETERDGGYVSRTSESGQGSQLFPKRLQDQLLPIHRRQERLQPIRFVSFLFQFDFDNQGFNSHATRIAWWTAIASWAILETAGIPPCLPGISRRFSAGRSLQRHQPPTSSGENSHRQPKSQGKDLRESLVLDFFPFAIRSLNRSRSGSLVPLHVVRR